MLPLVLAPAIAKTAIGGLQAIFGAVRGNDIDRPVRTTSPAIEEGVARTRYLAQGENPESQYVREQTEANQAGTVAQIQKSGGTSATTMAAALGAQKQAERTNLAQGVQDQQFKLNANTQYMQMLQQLAEQHQMNFQWNEAQKFMEESDAARRLKEAGLTNLVSGVTDVAGGAYAYNALSNENPTSSPFWNQKMGYMNTPPSPNPLPLPIQPQ